MPRAAIFLPQRRSMVSSMPMMTGPLGRKRSRIISSSWRAMARLSQRFQAQWLNVHVDFPLLQRIALPITIGSVRHPGIKIHETRVIRLMEVLLHGGPHVGGWTAKETHEAVLTTFGLSEKRYRLNQLRYDLRKLKGHPCW